MSAFFKYAIVLAAGLAIGSHVPGLGSLEDVGKRAWLDAVSNVINEALAVSKPDATAVPVDLNAAARIDEDLDYRIAQVTGSLEAAQRRAIHGIRR